MMLVTPEHLSTGLFKGVLTAAIMQLQSEAPREKFHIHFRYSLTQYGFQGQSALYQIKKQKRMQGLALSSLFCLLTMLPRTVKALDIIDKLPSKRLLTV